MIQLLKGAFFLLLASLVSVTNDVITKTANFSTSNTLFLRFFFASIILIPFIIKYRPKLTQQILIHNVLRGLVFGAGIFLYTISLKSLPLAMNVAIMNSIPFWVVLFACLFLKEAWNERLISVLAGIGGVIIACIPIWQTGSLLACLILLLSALMFAALDVFNKYLLNKDQSMLMMLFCSNLSITLFYLPFFNFSNIAFLEILKYGLALGLGANLLLYFILKAWSMCDISALQPMKFIEFPLALFVGSIVFEDKANFWLISGVGIMLCAAILNIYYEIRNSKKK